MIAVPAVASLDSDHAVQQPMDDGQVQGLRFQRRAQARSVPSVVPSQAPGTGSP